MDLQHIPLDNLKTAAANVRHQRKRPDVGDILPSIRERGILQPLLVRPNGDGFEVVAGRRRLHAAKTLAEDGREIGDIPCAVMAPGDDAAAIEASLLENVARLPMDPMAQYEAFARLVKEGRTVEEIAATFAIGELQVKRTLALANLLPAIRRLFTDERIDIVTLRHLTLATKAQQKEWLKLWKDKDAHTPTGPQLKRWLLGGEQIACHHALFDLAEYNGPIISDLFGEEQYFGDPEKFWALQMCAVAARAEALKANGWADVIVLERGDHFPEWNHEKTPKKKGGKVFVTIGHHGDVTFHEGYLSRKEIERGRKGATENEPASAKPEITKAMQTYVELHRHGLARSELLSHPGVALRLAVAHMTTGSSLWSVQPEPQRAPKPEITASVNDSTAQAAFETERKAVLDLLGLATDREHVVRRNGDSYWTALMFSKLLKLSDAEVLRVLTFVMAETLEAGSCLVEALGNHLGIDPVGTYRPDDTFVDLLMDKKTINAVLRDIASDAVADANSKETGKVQKKIIRDFLTGSNGRAKRDGWVPAYLKVPYAAHTKIPPETTRVGAEWRRVSDLFEARQSTADA